MLKCQVCEVNDLVEENEMATGECHYCLANLMNDGMYCD